MDSVCDICGCNQKNLVDGFYYCAECGTQDTNAQETIIEVVHAGDGFRARGSHKRIKHMPQAKQQMTDDWYRWHAMNFLLHGLANEMLELGAAPSFKTKLLWIWTRYMKKFQNKADFGLEVDENDLDKEKPAVEKEQIEGDDENMDENFFEFEEDEDKIDKDRTVRGCLTVSEISIPLITSMIYVALNLDKSDIQLGQLLRFIKEERLSLTHWQKFVPPELKPKKLRFCLLRNKYVNSQSFKGTLNLSMQLYQELDLGNPIVPDLRQLTELYLEELRLPNDIKPLVLSLMHYRSFDYLDIDVSMYQGGRLPSYELYVMAHIICAVKICFGVDGQYEDKLSDAVEKINEMENHPKAYNSELTDRLFSFREWCRYVMFRKSLLWKHSLHLGAPHYNDMDDYVTFEHLADKPDFTKTLKDEIARDILNKMPDVRPGVIHKSEFPATLTPHIAYTKVIMDHQQDPEVKKLLSEDFRLYSLKYITEDMFLVDPDDVNPKNIITGVNKEHLNECGILRTFKSYRNMSLDKKMVFVRDCDNHNWMITKRPTSKHFHSTNINDSDCDATCADDNDSNTNETLNDISSMTSVNVNDETKMENDSKETVDESVALANLDSIIDMEIDKSKINDDNLLKIREENENENIFDDDFKDLDDIKEEKKNEEHDLDFENDEPTTEVPNGIEMFQFTDVLRHNRDKQMYREDRDSDASSVDSIHFNPDTWDRQKAIKELVIHACNTIQVSIPGQYIMRKKKKYFRNPKYENGVERARVKGLTKLKIQGLIDEYQNQIQNDILVQMSSIVKSAINQFNQTKEEVQEESPSIDTEEPLIEENPVNDKTIQDQNANEQTIQSLNDTQDTDVIEDVTHKLFDDDSDGETHAHELLPKKNPEFDEATHDVHQLYMKKIADSTPVPELKLHPKLFEIVDKKIEEGARPSSDESQDKHDSDEDLSLSVMQQINALHQQLVTQRKRKKGVSNEKLINNEIPPYNYWIKDYGQFYSPSSNCLRFVTELDDTFPTNFKILIEECADIVGCPSYLLYSYLQRVECFIKERFLRKRPLRLEYFDKEMKKFKKK